MYIAYTYISIEFKNGPVPIANHAEKLYKYKDFKSCLKTASDIQSFPI